jgi:Uncharacterised protein family (UPF0175)
MEIIITIPEELTNQLHTDTQELERRVREKIAVKLYQEGGERRTNTPLAQSEHAL